MSDEPIPDFDLYAALEVASDASAGAIRAAHRALVRRTHPDLNPDPAAVDATRRLNVARDWLSDPARRARYDGSRHGRGVAGAGQERSGPHRRFRPPLDLNARLEVIQRFAGECGRLRAEQLTRVAEGYRAVMRGEDPELAAATRVVFAECRRARLGAMVELGAADVCGRLEFVHGAVPPPVRGAVGWMVAALASVDLAPRESTLVRVQWRAWAERQATSARGPASRWRWRWSPQRDQSNDEEERHGIG